jgi:hypothetical protein
MTVGRLPSIEGGIQPTIFDAKGDLLAASAADTPARLAVGANDTVLTADSTAATGLKWATPAAGGGMTVLASGTLSGSAVNLTSISASYKDLKLVFRNYDPVTDGAQIELQLNSESGNSYFKELALFSDNQTFGTTFIELPAQDNGTSTSLLVVNFIDYANTTTCKTGCFYAVNNNNTTPTNARFQNAFFAFNKTAAISTININSSNANFSGGTYILYGVS